MIGKARFAAAAVAVAAALSGCSAPAAAPLAWSPCADDASLECATLTVPVDRAEPDGPTFALPAVRIPAGRPEERLGTIVLHRGGPGYSVVDYVTGIRSGTIPNPLTPQVYERYDVVAIEQRGAGRSQPAVRCAPTDGGTAELARSVPSIPLTEQERTARLAADAAFVRGCAENSAAILDHISTADAVRDLDALRAALGEERINFVGQSYGTFYGTVYANLFPDRVGRFVLDSVIDPAQISGDPGSLRSTRVGADTASAAAMEEFLRLCAAGGVRCAFGGGDPEGAWERLTTRLRDNPVQLAAPGGRAIRLGLSEVVSWTGNWLYQPSFWEQPIAGAAFLATAEAAAADPTGQAGRLLAQLLLNLRDEADLIAAPYGGALNATAFAVNCLENDYPAGPAAFTAAVEAGPVPLFGPLRGWQDSVCAQWDRHDGSYRGPWNARTAEPVLIVNSRFDPVTPLAAAQRLQSLLPGSALLVHEGPGHVAAQQSRCVVDAASAYLLTGAVPAPGTTCAPDRVPFT